MTTFDLPDADYAKGRAAFVEMKDDAWKKVDEIKKIWAISGTSHRREEELVAQS